MQATGLAPGALWGRPPGLRPVLCGASNRLATGAFCRAFNRLAAGALWYDPRPLTESHIEE
jgi:hypothetical protein